MQMSRGGLLAFESSGGNYWKRRWDDDNKYFFEIIKSIPNKVPPDGIFIADDVQTTFGHAYGDKPY